MTCKACDNATRHPSSGLYQAACKGCAARALAQSPKFFAAAKVGNLTPEYRQALSQFFPDAPVHEAHQLVKAWVR
jgi:hypothetical protein